MSLFQLQKDVSRARKHIGKRKTGGPAAPATAQSLRPRALNQSISYRVPGTVPIIPQGTPNVCWAASTAMMLSWLLGQTVPPDQAVARYGEPWVTKYKTDQLLWGADIPTFFNTVGLVQKGPANFSIADYLAMMQAHGPLWVITAENPAQPNITHATILVGISGDGSPAGTSFHIIDPASNTEKTKTFEAFLRTYERIAAKNRPAGKPWPQVPALVIHWSPDAKARVQQQSLSWRGHASGMGGAAVAEIIAAVGGAVVSGYVSKTEGDITYRLDMMDQIRCPAKAAKKEKEVQFDPMHEVREKEESTCYGMQIHMGVKINWHSNGTCVGPILMDSWNPVDRLGGSGTMVGRILLNEPPPVKHGAGGKPIIGVRIHFTCSFNCTLQNPEIRYFDVTVYADGSYTRGPTTI